MTWGSFDDLSMQIRSSRCIYLPVGDEDAPRRFVSADPRFPVSLTLWNWRSAFYDFNREYHLHIDALPIWVVREDLTLLAHRDRRAANILADPRRYAEIDARHAKSKLMREDAPLGESGHAPRFRWQGSAGESEAVVVLDQRSGLWAFERTPVTAVGDATWYSILRSVRWLSDAFFADVASNARVMATQPG